MPPTQANRNVVAEQTQPLGGGDRNLVNHTPQSDNPRHDYASRLESKQGGSRYQPTKDIACTPGPGRHNVNHAPVRTGYHSHMGTSKVGHKFPGRRV